MRKMFQHLFIGVAILALSSSVAHAADSFSITPPPIAAPTFEEGKTDSKVRLTYLTMKGDGSDFKGYGADAVFRNAFTGSFAGDLQLGMLALNGNMNTGAGMTASTDFVNFSFGVNGEYQAYKGDTFSALFFAGPNLTLLVGSYKYNYTIGTTTSSDTATLTGDLIGLEGGVQFGINAGNWQIAPFATIMSQQGSITASTSYGDTTTNIKPFTTTSYGMDITYVPWGLSLSAILQEAAKQSDANEGIKTNIYQISWHF